MKKVYIPLFALLFMLSSACGEDKKKSTSKASNVIKQTKSVVKAKKELKTYHEQLKEHEDRLKTMKPINKKVLVDWFPTEVNDMPRKKIEETRSGFENSTVVKAIYSNNAKGDDLKMFNVEIMDGAGPQASGVVAGHIAQRAMTVDQENASGHQKYVTHNNMKVYEFYSKNYNSTNLTFAANQRYGIRVGSHNLNPEELWAYVDQLDFTSLIN